MAKSLLMAGGWLCLVLTGAQVGAARADDGKELFQSKCASCHTIGGGAGVGPDLKGVTSRHPTDWLVRIITEPDKLAAEKDPAQVELVKKYGMEMPNLGVSHPDAQKILAFLGGMPPAAAAAPETPPAPTAGTEAPAAAPVVATPALLAKGRALFTGADRFAKGGAPCVSCHELRYPGVQGGTVGADLTDFYGRMGETGVRGVLQSLSFPVMKRVYADHHLDEAEMTPLIALFKDASARHQKACTTYPYSGLGCFALFVAAAIVIRRRIR